MPTRKAIEQLIGKVTRRMTDLQPDGTPEVCGISIIDFERWEWPQGVGLYGIWTAFVHSKDPEKLSYLTAWFSRRRAEGLPVRNVNTMAPMLTLAHLFSTTGQPSDLELCEEWAEWIMECLPRTEEGGFQHVTTDLPFEQQLWADTLFMTVLFLAKMGVVTGRQRYIDESVRQFLLHIKYLHDRKTGLWFHGWNFIGRHNFAEALWARGNCWITAGIVDYLAMVKLPEGVKEHLLATLEAQAEGLARTQATDGTWHTLLDDPSSYTETSATAGFAFGLLRGVRLGFLPPRFAEVGRHALEAVIRRISADGTVEGVSYGTPMGADLEHYRTIPRCPMGYGQALTVLLLTEALAWPDSVGDHGLLGNETVSPSHYPPAVKRQRPAERS